MFRKKRDKLYTVTFNDGGSMTLLAHEVYWPDEMPTEQPQDPWINFCDRADQTVGLFRSAQVKHVTSVEQP